MTQEQNTATTYRFIYKDQFGKMKREDIEVTKRSSDLAIAKFEEEHPGIVWRTFAVFEQNTTCDCTHTQACEVCAASKDIDWNIIELKEQNTVAGWTYRLDPNSLSPEFDITRPDGSYYTTVQYEQQAKEICDTFNALLSATARVTELESQLDWERNLPNAFRCPKCKNICTTGNDQHYFMCANYSCEWGGRTWTVSHIDTMIHNQELTDKVAELEAQLRKTEWVSVEDRLPQEAYEVLVYTETHWCTKGYLLHNDWILYFRQGIELSTMKITHWKPLPKGPIPPQNTKGDGGN